MKFRDFYDEYTLISLTNELRFFTQDYDGVSEANYCLAFGTIQDGRLVMVVLALVKKTAQGCHFFQAKSEHAVTLEAHFFTNCSYAKAPVLPDLSYTKIPEEIRDTMDEHAFNFYDVDMIDEWRHPEYPGMIQVFFDAEDLQREVLWVQWTDMLSNQINLGILLDEPSQDLGIHEGDEVSFAFVADNEDDYYCLSFLDVLDGEPKGDPNDGSLLQNTTNLLSNYPNKEHFLLTTKVLANCRVWVSCTVDKTKYSKDQIEVALQNDDFNLNKIEHSYFEIGGIPFERNDNTIMGYDFYVSVYSTKEYADAYGCGNISIPKSVPEVLLTAIHDEKEFKGLRVDAQLPTEFYVERDFWSELLKMSGDYNMRK